MDMTTIEQKGSVIRTFFSKMSYKTMIAGQVPVLPTPEVSPVRAGHAPMLSKLAGRGLDRH
jgi:hypothetical protein